ncbi:MAG: Type leader peptidase family [Actinomycetota bacterium]
MAIVGAIRVAPTTSTTADRLGAAWMHATRPTRRAVVLSVLTSVVFGAMTPATNGVRGALVMCGAATAAAALVDVHERRLPNRLVLLALCCTLTPLLWGTPAEVVRVAAGLSIAGALMLGVRVRRGVGMGDVKLAAVIGGNVALIALPAVPVAIAAAAAAAAAGGWWLRRTSLPLGPALWFGWAVAVATAGTGWWT